MKLKICRCSLFPSWSGYGLIGTPVHFWQHVSAVNSHHQTKIEQSLGTLKVCTLWDLTSFTAVYNSWYVKILRGLEL